MIKLKDLLIEGNPRKGDHVKSIVHGEIGVIEKVKGKIAWVTYPGDKKRSWPSDIRTFKEALPSFVKGKLRNLWIEK